jgi:hypothetical protein
MRAEPLVGWIWQGSHHSACQGSAASATRRLPAVRLMQRSDGSLGVGCGSAASPSGFAETTSARQGATGVSAAMCVPSLVTCPTHSVCVPWQCGASEYTAQLQLAPCATLPVKVPMRSGCELAGLVAKSSAACP